MTTDSGLLDTVLDRDEAELAKTAQRCIISSLDHSKAVSIAILEEGVERLSDDAPVLRLPPRVLRLFADMLGSLAQGKGVAIMPQEAYLTTQQAAMFLNVSRPFFIKLLDEQKIPHHKVGAHRRVLLEDVIRYKEQRQKSSQEALQKLTEQAEDLDMGY